MECILCGKELDGDAQLCGECAVDAVSKDPLWVCREYLIGDSVPDILSRRSYIVLSLGGEKEGFIDGKKPTDDVRLPEKPTPRIASRIFWKINMYLDHMGIPLYMEDTEDIELTLSDIDNASHMLNVAASLEEFLKSADEETLSRLASSYFHAMSCVRNVKGLDGSGREELTSVLEKRMKAYLSAGEGIMPHRGHIFMNQAYLANLSGDFRSALELYRMVPEHDSNPRALTGMGRAYEGLEMWESADEAYTRALRLDDRWVPAWEGKASAALASERWGAALQFISRAISLRPDMARLYILKGDILAGQGLISEAEKEYQKAIARRHGERGWLKRGELMYNAGRWGAALQFVERYLFIFPDDEEGLWWRERIKQAVDDGRSF